MIGSLGVDTVPIQHQHAKQHIKRIKQQQLNTLYVNKKKGTLYSIVIKVIYHWIAPQIAHRVIQISAQKNGAILARHCSKWSSQLARCVTAGSLQTLCVLLGDALKLPCTCRQGFSWAPPIPISYMKGWFTLYPCPTAKLCNNKI